MHKFPRQIRVSFMLAALSAVLLTAACATTHSGMGSEAARLTGAQEVPANASTASGESTIRVADDKSVSGMITVSGMTATAAHIHQAAKGSNGGVIVPLTKATPSTFAVPPDTKLTDAQYASYKDGNLYINVHSAAFPGGEIRTQINSK